MCFFSRYCRTKREKSSLHKDKASLSDRALSSRMQCPQQEGGGLRVRRGQQEHEASQNGFCESQLSRVTSLPPPSCPLLFCLTHQVMSSLCINMIVVVITVSSALLFFGIPLLYCHVLNGPWLSVGSHGCRCFEQGGWILYAVLDLPSSSLIASMSSSFSFDSSFLISSRISCFNLS